MLFGLQNHLCELKRENKHSKGDFVLKNQFETFVLKISGLQK